METSVRTDERLSMETENISIDPYENDPVVLGYRSLGKVLASMATTPSVNLEENMPKLMTKFAISSKEQNVCLELGDSEKDSLNWLEESGLAVKSENLVPEEIQMYLLSSIRLENHCVYISNGIFLKRKTWPRFCICYP